MSDTNQDRTFEPRSFGYGKRLLRRVEDGALRRPFLPFGFLPALILGGLAFYCMFVFSRHIQARTLEAAEIALRDNGLNWASVTVDGQDVTLSGVPPSDFEAKQAIEVVTKQTGRTPLWSAPPAEIVRANYATMTTPGPVTPPASAAVPAVVANDWTFRVVNGELFLEGGVPDAEMRQRIADIGNQAVRTGQVRRVYDNLKVTGKAEPQDYLSVALRGVSIVTRCDRATSQFVAQRFSLYCELPRAAEASVRSDASSPLQFGTLGNIEILTNESVSDCENQLASLLTGASIEFATGRDTISGASSSLLDRISQAAKACPGTLRIEGHTDSTGSSALNANLSQRRAEAVRNALIARGVEAGRLMAQGYGSSQPKAGNDTDAGRALNRRIEIEVVRAPD